MQPNEIKRDFLRNFTSPEGSEGDGKTCGGECRPRHSVVSETWCDKSRCGCSQTWPDVAVWREEMARERYGMAVRREGRTEGNGIIEGLWRDYWETAEFESSSLTRLRRWTIDTA
jgi:hypothetical protein